MIIKNVTRGTTVKFTSEFYNANNEVITPASPKLRVYYRSNNEYITVESDMTAEGALWTGSWDSSNADVGMVQWNISSSGVSEDGAFRLIANHANFGTVNPI